MWFNMWKFHMWIWNLFAYGIFICEMSNHIWNFHIRKEQWHAYISTYQKKQLYMKFPHMKLPHIKKKSNYIWKFQIWNKQSCMKFFTYERNKPISKKKSHLKFTDLHYYYYLRIFIEDKHFSIIHTVINANTITNKWMQQHKICYLISI